MSAHLTSSCTFQVQNEWSLQRVFFLWYMKIQWDRNCYLYLQYYRCHESGCHSLQLHITHGLHLPSCTAHTHSRPPLHQSHSCHHSLINPDCLATPAPHSLTHIKAAHKHSPSAKSCFPLANILSVSPVFWFRVFTWTAYLLWPFAACPFDPACLLISSPFAACPDLALSLLLILSSLHNSCYYLWPLPVWPPLVNH